MRLMNPPGGYYRRISRPNTRLSLLFIVRFFPIVNFSLPARRETPDIYDEDNEDNENGDSATLIIMANERFSSTRHIREFPVEFWRLSSSVDCRNAE